MENQMWLLGATAVLSTLFVHKISWSLNKDWSFSQAYAKQEKHLWVIVQELVLAWKTVKTTVIKLKINSSK